LKCGGITLSLEYFKIYCLIVKIGGYLTDTGNPGSNSDYVIDFNQFHQSKVEVGPFKSTIAI